MIVDRRPLVWSSAPCSVLCVFTCGRRVTSREAALDSILSALLRMIFMSAMAAGVGRERTEDAGAIGAGGGGGGDFPVNASLSDAFSFFTRARFQMGAGMLEGAVGLVWRGWQLLALLAVGSRVLELRAVRGAVQAGALSD